LVVLIRTSRWLGARHERSLVLAEKENPLEGFIRWRQSRKTDTEPTARASEGIK